MAGLKGRGGAGRGQGRKPKGKIPQGPSKEIADRVLQLVAAPIHPGNIPASRDKPEKVDCRCEECRWYYFLHLVPDIQIQFSALDKLTSRKYGRAAQKVIVDPFAFDPNAPLKVLVEHIGRGAQNSPAAKAK